MKQVSLKKKHKLVDLLQKGNPLFESLEKLHIDYNTYRRARTEDADFGHAVDRARAEHYTNMKLKMERQGGRR